MLQLFPRRSEFKDPADPELAARLEAEGRSLSAEGESRRAERLLHRAAEIYRLLMSSDPEAYELKAAVCYNLAGTEQEFLKKYEDARRYYQMAVDLLERSSRKQEPAVTEQLADEYSNIGDTFFYKSKYADAKKYYQLALGLYAELEKTGEDTYKEDVAYSLDSLAKVHVGEKEYVKAMELYQKAIGIYEGLLASQTQVEMPEDKALIENYSSELADEYISLGYVFSCVKDYEDAEEYYKKAAELYERLAKVNPGEFVDILASHYEDMAALYEDMKQPDLEELYLDKAQRLHY